MSYDIYIEDDVGPIMLDEPIQANGGTYALGGTTEAWLNITYNYSGHYYRTIDRDEGIRWLYGKSVKEALPRLRAAIAELGTDTDPDYWEGTPGNAGAALADLVKIAEACPPNAVFSGD